MARESWKELSDRMFSWKQNNVPVECKCPLCEKKHTVMHKCKPLVMPRIACNKCKPHFGMPDEMNRQDMRGVSLRSHAAQNHKRKAA